MKHIAPFQRLRTICLLLLLAVATSSMASTNDTAGCIASTNCSVLWTHPAFASLADLPRPSSPTAYTLSGRGWTFRHDPNRFGSFVIQAGDHVVEHVPFEPLVLLGPGDRVSTLCLTQAEMNVHTPSRLHQRLETTIHLIDANGRTWTLRRTFRPENENRELLISTDILYDPHHDDPNGARVLHVPYLTLLVDRFSSGHKHQALLAGVEYLGDERSSSACDISTPEHDRRIPADFRLTSPLAVFTSKTHALSAQWFLSDPNMPERFATVFDTPDRIFQSGGHLLAFWAPAVGPARAESSLSLTAPTPFRHGRHTIRLRVTDGGFVTDALDAVLSAADLPPPTPLPHPDTLKRLATEGRTILTRAPARLLAAQLLLATNFTATLDQLVRTNQASTPLTANAEPFQTNHAHLRDPLDLTAPGTPATCGQLARQIKGSLTAATWSGDEAFIARSLAAIDRLTTLTRGNVPRGGHPTELPLHTPDLQAATDLAACYADAVLLRPRESTLRDARRWATAGLAFIRLTPFEMGTDPGKMGTDPGKMGTDPGKMGTDPGEMGTDPVGCYTATAALGASRGTGPSWIGVPRTAEALSYADLLVRLARLEPTRRRTRYWRLLAQGITHTAVQQLYPANDPIDGGLLPTAWDLRTQRPCGIPRDPFALQILAAEFSGLPFASCRTVPFDPARPSLLHVPGSVSPARKNKSTTETGFSCSIACWPETPCRAVLTRVNQPLTVALDGQSLSVEHLASRRLLVIKLPPRAAGRLVLTELRTGGLPSANGTNDL